MTRLHTGAALRRLQKAHHPPSPDYTEAMRKDASRLAELQRTMLLDSPRERAYDDLTRLLATALDVPMTMVNLLDGHRDWFKSSVGVTLDEGLVETSFCEAFFETTDDLLVVPDTTQDPRFALHPLVLTAPFVRFYVGVRLVVNGQTLGTLCAYDVKPRVVTSEQVERVRALSMAAMELLAKTRG
jgi:GAF domain-containing protein